MRITTMLICLLLSLAMPQLSVAGKKQGGGGGGKAAHSGGGDLHEVEDQTETSEQAGPLIEGALQAGGGVRHGVHDAYERVDILTGGVGVTMQGDGYRIS